MAVISIAETENWRLTSVFLCERPVRLTALLSIIRGPAGNEGGEVKIPAASAGWLPAQVYFIQNVIKVANEDTEVLLQYNTFFFFFFC